MPVLATHHDFQALQNLPFCYLCGKQFAADDVTNRDHLPPQTIFLKADRTPTLWLPAHAACNSAQSLVDEKIGQLIALRYGKIPADTKNRRLKFEPHLGLAALSNLDVDAAIWRWIAGFHAALYEEPYVDTAIEPSRAITTPFPRAPKGMPTPTVEPIRPQHLIFVEHIKTNRALLNVDRVQSNNGKLTYECAWRAADNGAWMCVFALNLYDWKDLGRTPQHPARGCAGFYVLPHQGRPNNATVGRVSPILLPNVDPLDPFAP